jgi:hypothetical protein
LGFEGKTPSFPRIKRAQSNDPADLRRQLANLRGINTSLGQALDRANKAITKLQGDLRGAERTNARLRAANTRRLGRGLTPTLRARMEKIVQKVVAQHEVPKEAIINRARGGQVFAARCAFVAAARASGISQEAIGLYLDGRSRAAVAEIIRHIKAVAA